MRDDLSLTARISYPPPEMTARLMASRRQVTTLVLLALLGGARSASAADFTWAPVENLPEWAEVVMVGDIVEGDAEKLRQAIETANGSGRLVISAGLYSRGGSLSEGLKIGRILRANRISTRAPSEASTDMPDLFICSMTAGSYLPLSNSVENPDCSCFSACALAWLGGVGRGGSVGLHRAYLGDRDARYDDYESTISGAATEVHAYLDEMRVPSFVFDKIMTTASADVVILSEEERNRIRFDPVFSEFLIARCGTGPSKEDRELESKLAAKKYAGASKTPRWLDWMKLPAPTPSAG